MRVEVLMCIDLMGERDDNELSCCQDQDCCGSKFRFD